MGIDLKTKRHNLNIDIQSLPWWRPWPGKKAEELTNLALLARSVCWWERGRCGDRAKMPNIQTQQPSATQSSNDVGFQQRPEPSSLLPFYTVPCQYPLPAEAWEFIMTSRWSANQAPASASLPPPLGFVNPNHAGLSLKHRWALFNILHEMSTVLKHMLNKSELHEITVCVQTTKMSLMLWGWPQHYTSWIWK